MKLVTSKRPIIGSKKISSVWFSLQKGAQNLTEIGISPKGHKLFISHRDGNFETQMAVVDMDLNMRDKIGKKNYS